MKTLHAKGYSASKIAALLGCSHHTVVRYINNDFTVTPREQQPGVLKDHADFLLERFLRHNGNADVVRQELVSELGIDVSLRTVQRALRTHRAQLRAAKLVTTRYETEPGEQMQIDFGVKAVSSEGCQQPVHVFVATLGYSRRVFAKAYPQETQTAWFDGMELAFEHFGGVPRTVLMDNAKALVTRPSRGDQPTEFNDRLQAFARYWSFIPKACRPARAQTKGKVERCVGYVKANALAGHTFASWGELDRQLASWLVTVADHRALTVATDTPLVRFTRDYEALSPLQGKPRFGVPQEFTRTVNVDAMIVFETNSYSVPWSLLGQRLRVTPTATTVRIYQGPKLVAQHQRCTGRYQRMVEPAHFQDAPSPHRQVPQDPSLVRPLTTYAAAIEESSE